MCILSGQCVLSLRGCADGLKVVFWWTCGANTTGTIAHTVGYSPNTYYNHFMASTYTTNYNNCTTTACFHVSANR